MNGPTPGDGQEQHNSMSDNQRITNLSLSKANTHAVLSNDPEANRLPSQFQPTLCTLEL